LGRDSHRCRDRPSDLGLVAEQEPKKKGGNAYRLIKRILSIVTDLNPDTDVADLDPEFLTYFEMTYTWIMYIHQDWNHRIPFATDSGNFGYASTDIAEGDTICMLYGGRTMYVLRERGNEQLEYQFVSDAYVYGCMDGQVFDLIDEGVVKEELFAIS
jgi:hypothetical protein